MKKVLLDTDIGSDIDDAVCLAYLLAQPECDLLGITTVTGEAVRRAELASALCRVAGRDIPIYPGVEAPLLTEIRQPGAAQAAALGAWPHQSGFPCGQAIDFLRDTIRRHPGEVSLLTIGPLTNAALLFAVDPEIPSLLKELVMMCGVFDRAAQQKKAVEWNAWNDPYATAMVYRHPVAVHRSIGLDVTLQVVMTADEVRRRFEAPLLKPVLDFADVWFRSVEHITFHDPLAAVTLFDEPVCGFEQGHVDVELDPSGDLGKTCWTADGTDHEVAFRVDAPRFFERYFRVFEETGA